MTREEWLRAAAVLIEQDVLAPAGGVLTREIAVSVGFPSTRATANKNRRIGECWKAAGDAPNHVFIHPELDPGQVLGVLVHELIHAVDNCQSGHKGRFRTIALAAGLEGKMTATYVKGGSDLDHKLDAIVRKLGPFPHKALKVVKRPKQTTRMVKLECFTCGCIVRTSQKWIDEYPRAWECPCGQGELEDRE